jgi:hypothetical protein
LRIFFDHAYFFLTSPPLHPFARLWLFPGGNPEPAPNAGSGAKKRMIIFRTDVMIEINPRPRGKSGKAGAGHELPLRDVKFKLQRNSLGEGD